jgi:hypothetical protein
MVSVSFQNFSPSAAKSTYLLLLSPTLPTTIYLYPIC